MSWSAALAGEPCVSANPLADALDGGVACGDVGCCEPFDMTRIPPPEEMRRFASELGCCSLFTGVGTDTGVPFGRLNVDCDGVNAAVEGVGGCCA